MKSGSSSQYIKLLFVFFIVGLGLCGLADLAGSSEARELEVVRSVLKGDSILFPTRIGMVPSKPPLMHWLAASMIWLTDLSVTPGAVRALSLLCAFFLLWLTGMIASRAVPDSRSSVPLLSVGILATTYEFQRIAFSARVDMLFSLLVTIAIASVLFPVYLQSQNTPSRSHPWYSLFAISTALAVLTKGPLGIVFPLFISWILLVAAFGWRDATIRLVTPRWQWILFFLVAMPWYGWSMYEYSETFSSRVLFENITRFLGGEHIVSKPLWYYIPSYLLRAFPWSIIFLGALFTLRRDKNGTRFFSSAAKPFLLWFLVGFTLFSLSDGKRHAYLTPLFPASSIIVAMFLDEIYQRLSDNMKRYIRFTERTLPFLFFSLLSFITSAIGYFVYMREWHPQRDRYWQVAEFFTQHQLLFAFFVVASMLYCVVSISRQKELPIVFWVTLLTAVAFGLNVGLAVKAQIKGYRRMADSIGEDLSGSGARGSGARFVLVKDPEDELFDPIMFYLDRTPALMRPRDSLTQLTCEDIFLTRKEFLQDWHVALGRYNFLSDKLNEDTNRAIVLGKRKDC